MFALKFDAVKKKARNNLFPSAHVKSSNILAARVKIVYTRDFSLLFTFSTRVFFRLTLIKERIIEGEKNYFFLKKTRSFSLEA